MRIMDRYEEDDQIVLRVRDLPPSALAKRGGRYEVISEGDEEEIALLTVAPGKNAEVRAQKFATRHEAIDILDTKALDAALAPAKPVRTKVAPVNQADLLREDEEEDDPDLRALLDEDEEVEDGEAEEDEIDDIDETALDEQLLAWGYTPEEIDALEVDQKFELVEQKVIKRTRRPKKVDALTADDEGSEQTSEQGSEQGSEQAPPAETPAPRTKRKPPTPGAEKAAKRREALREEGVKVTPGGIDRSEETTPAIRGYRVTVSRSNWPTYAGPDGTQLPRTYTVGDTPSEDEANETAERWKAAGFTVKVDPLAWHHKAPTAKRTIWAGEPFHPILCRFPGCTWTGDHLAPHIRHHGLTFDEYAEGFKYDGPPVVGAATASLTSAQDAIRRRSDISAGQFIVHIRGTHDAEVWRIVKIAGEGEGRTFVVEAVTGDGDGDPVRATYDATELTAKFLPVTPWAHRLLKELGIGKKKAAG